MYFWKEPIPKSSQNSHRTPSGIGKQALGCEIMAVCTFHTHACERMYEHTRPEHLKAPGHHIL